MTSEGTRIAVKYMEVRECSDALALNAKISLQQNLNRSVAERLDKISDLHRVVTINYTDSAAILNKNCALATVWYEVLRGATPGEGERK